MKKTSLIFSLLLTLGATSYAQVTQKQTVSKNQVTSDVKGQYLSKVDELNRLLKKQKVDESKLKWAEINNIVTSISASNEERIDKLQSTGDKAALDNLMGKIRAQGQRYNKIVILASHMADNAVEFDAALRDFAANMF